MTNGVPTTYTLDYADGNRILAERTLPDASGYVRQGTDSQGQITSAWTFDPDGTVLVGPKGLVGHLVYGGVYDWSTSRLPRIIPHK